MYHAFCQGFVTYFFVVAFNDRSGLMFKHQKCDQIWCCRSHCKRFNLAWDRTTSAAAPSTITGLWSRPRTVACSSWCTQSISKWLPENWRKIFSIKR